MTPNHDPAKTNGQRATDETKPILTPLKAIRAWCLECSGQNAAEVRRCPKTDCPLYSYRMGKRPPSKKPRTPAQIEADRKNAERLRAKARSQRLDRKRPASVDAGGADRREDTGRVDARS
jgi:hypothetical protein